MTTLKIVLASHNQHKIKEMTAMLRERLNIDLEILSLDDVGITEDIEENGNSFLENAMIKARAAAKSGYIGLADDSGLTVEALGGAPGIYSARYAGEHGNDDANNQKLLREMQGKAYRAAAYICAMALVFPDGTRPLTAEGRLDGEILLSPRGEGGFGYDPLFWIDPLGKTLAEIPMEEKNQFSHRRRAIDGICEQLAMRLGLYSRRVIDASTQEDGEDTADLGNGQKISIVRSL